MEIYTCPHAESLAQLARRFSLSPERLAEANGLWEGQLLPAGLSLLIPGREGAGREGAELWFCSGRSLAAEELRWLQPRASALLLPEQAEGGMACFLCLSGEELQTGREEDREALLQTLPEQLTAGGFRGLCLPLRYLPPFQREALSRFLLRLAETLHREGFWLLAATPPLDGRAASAGIDGEMLGHCCDRVLLQCCDWGHPATAPQATAPLPLVEQSLDAALSHIPARKLLLGLSGQGCRWKLPWRPGLPGEALSHERAQALALVSQAPIRFDRAAQCPFFPYRDGLGQRFGIWYEDARSMAGKLRFVGEYGLAGAALFGAASGDSLFFRLMGEMYNVEALG